MNQPTMSQYSVETSVGWLHGLWWRWLWKWWKRLNDVHAIWKKIFAYFYFLASFMLRCHCLGISWFGNKSFLHPMRTLETLSLPTSNRYPHRQVSSLTHSGDGAASIRVMVELTRIRPPDEEKSPERNSQWISPLYVTILMESNFDECCYWSCSEHLLSLQWFIISDI